jgi:hypothetical protein
MAATSDWRLYQLYMEFGEAQDRRARAIEAADAYALALYYARRLNDPARINECRQLVISRSPNHIGAQQVSAPLFFAQLLMRYPADEVEMMLTGGRPSVAVAEEPPPHVSPPPYQERSFRQTQTIKPTYERVEGDGERHHSEPTFTGMPRNSAASFVSDDVLLSDAGLTGEDDENRSSKRTTVADLSTAVKALAAGTITSGLLLVAYVGYSLYPMMNQRQREAASSGAHASDTKIIVTEESEQLKPAESVTAPPAAVVKAPPIAEAGANMPVSLPADPEPKLSAKSKDADGTR